MQTKTSSLTITPRASTEPVDEPHIQAANRDATATSRRRIVLPTVDLEKAALADEAEFSKRHRIASRRAMTSRSRNRQSRLTTMLDADDSCEDGPQLYSKASPDPTTRLGFLLKNVASRGPTAAFSLVPSTFQKVFTQTTSTLHGLDLWMEDDTTKRHLTLLGLGAVSAIFNIVRSDIEDFLHLYEDTPDTIEQLSLDQRTVEKMLPSWRSLMNLLGNELRYLEARLPSLAAFIALDASWSHAASSPTTSKWPNPSFDIEGTVLPRLLASVRRLQDRTQHSSDALVASVSFLQSRRGIDEAQSVTRLTQLGKLGLRSSVSNC